MIIFIAFGQKYSKKRMRENLVADLSHVTDPTIRTQAAENLANTDECWEEVCLWMAKLEK
jgi:catalase